MSNDYNIFFNGKMNITRENERSTKSD